MLKTKLVVMLLLPVMLSMSRMMTMQMPMKMSSPLEPVADKGLHDLPLHQAPARGLHCRGVSPSAGREGLVSSFSEGINVVVVMLVVMLVVVVMLGTTLIPVWWIKCNFLRDPSLSDVFTSEVPVHIKLVEFLVDLLKGSKATVLLITKQQ